MPHNYAIPQATPHATPPFTLTDVFVLKLRESLIKSLKITVKKISKSILRCRKNINRPLALRGHLTNDVIRVLNGNMKHARAIDFE